MSAFVGIQHNNKESNTESANTECSKSAKNNDDLQKILMRCQAVQKKDESVFEALHRTSREHNWKANTLNKWRKRVSQVIQKRVDVAFSSQDTLNHYLRVFQLPERKSKNGAIKLLKSKVFINIYDLVAGRYERRHPSRTALRKYTNRKKLYFPLKSAKSNEVRTFLCKMKS